jgi:hypothetical protein
MTRKLSDAQICVLIRGLDSKLERRGAWWSEDDRKLPTDPVRIYSERTIASLDERGLIEREGDQIWTSEWGERVLARHLKNNISEAT